MKLTQLELAGFKSFVDTTKFSFSKGLTGIVGPNGCGKSNICDAIHWVLGEQNPRRLRGDSMKDVIFKGTRKRTQHSFTEVSITIENDKKILPIEYEDVKITRKFYRDGESDFSINNNSCRLKDILNLFYDTGMGRRAYSLMEQTMIDAILSSNDEERRYLFEEAAGIMKYNKSRRASENKLQSVKNDLLRLEDIIAEVKFQVNSLRKQVGKAKRFQNLKQKINRIQIQLAGIKFFEYQNNLKISQSEFLDIEKKLTIITKDVNKKTKIYNEKNEKLLGIEIKLKDEQKQQKSVEDEINNFEREILLNKQQISNSKSICDENQKRIENIKSQNSDTKKSLSNDTENFKQNQEKLSALQNKAENSEKILKLLKEKISKNQKELEILDNKLDEFSENKNNLLNENAEIKSRQKLLSEQKKHLKEKICDLENEFQKISNSKNENEKSKKNVDSELLTFQKKLTKVELDFQNLIKQKNEIFNKIQNKEFSIKSLKNEQNQLIVWEKNFVGYETGTKKLIENFDDKNISILGNNLKVDEKYATLIERFLKSILPSAICPENIVQDALEMLENKNLNSNIVISKNQNYEVKDNLKIENATSLNDIIKIQKLKIDPRIFNNFYIVSDRNVAQKLSDKFQNFDSEIKFVTQKGEVFSNFGIIETNWQNENKSGFLSQKNKLKKIQEEIEVEEISLKKLKNNLSETASQKSKISDEINVLHKKADKLKISQEKLKNEIYQFGIQEENLKNLIDENNSEISKIQQNLTKISNRKKEVEEELSAFSQNSNEGSIENQKKIRRNLTTLRSEKNERENALNNIKIEIAKLEKDVFFLSENIKKYKENISQNEEILSKSKESIVQQKKSIENLKNVTSDLEKKFRSKLEILNNFKAKTIKTENIFHSLRSELDKFKLELHELNFKKDIFAEDKSNIELKIQETKINAEHIQDDTFSRFHYDLTHDDADDYIDLNLEELVSESSQNQKKLDNLGPINLAAIDDYDTQKKRLKFLQEQKKDLIESQKNLQEAIKKLNKTAEKMFVKTFQQIKENFEKLFKEIFNGGRGILRIIDDSLPLTSKIEIHASPKGKKISNINLLSTGEKTLTAIALLFSIYLVKPSPFCILDEIDAPLDDSNINRFLLLLNKFSENTQFIIITHNKRTVEAVDYLYGITMEESGVSKIVSVSFS